MKTTSLADIGISAHLPPDLRTALMDAENWPPRDRMHRIDKLTDEAARRGLARDRGDCSMASQWARTRGAA